MHDNLELNPSEFYYAIKDINLSIEELSIVKKNLSDLSNLGVDTFIYVNKVKNIDDELNILYKKLSRVKKELLKLDGVKDLFDYLDDNENKEEDNSGFGNFEENSYISNDERLDNVKGNNKNLGGKRSDNASSILLRLKGLKRK